MPFAAVYMFIALGLYTYAVFNGRKEGLRGKHLIFFGLGLIMDSTGTYQMAQIAAASNNPNPLHLYTGLFGLFGMGIHFLLALWATFSRKADKANHTFHKVSMVIYTLWVIAFLSGAIMAAMG